MQRIKNSQWLLLGTLMLVLILDSRCVLEGGRDGIGLCLKSVIPALFPFLVLAPMFTAELAKKNPGILQPVCRALNLPAGGHALLITGFLSGYPVGAQCIARSVQRGEISPQQGKRLMGFCCNCGPGFLFGICGQFFESIQPVVVLWLIHILSAAATGLLLPRETANGSIIPDKAIGPTQAMSAAVRAMAMICGWVIAFRVLLEFANRWVLWAVPTPLRILAAGTMELTNGCLLLGMVENPSLRLILCEAMLTFGGLCVMMQTAAVSTGMGFGQYVPGKLLQTGIATTLAALYCGISGNDITLITVAVAIIALVGIGGGYFLRKNKKTSRNLTSPGV